MRGIRAWFFESENHLTCKVWHIFYSVYKSYLKWSCCLIMEALSSLMTKCENWVLVNAIVVSKTKYQPKWLDIAKDMYNLHFEYSAPIVAVHFTY